VVEVRVATAADEDVLAALDRAAWTSLSTPAPPPGAEWTFFDEKTAPADVLVGLSEGEVAGYLKLGPATPLGASAHILMINGFAVDPAMQGRGVGRALIGAAIAEARRRRARRLRLRVLGLNARARGLYESAGFVVDGVLPGEFFLDGVYVDDVFMGLDLAAPD
jgi:ribosomal protein S18 acetylase RimI-like enzyme